MKFKPVFRRDGRLIRLCRLVWTRGKVGDGKGYSCKLSLGLQPTAFHFSREFKAIFLTILGLRIHFEQSFGGIHD